MLLRRTPKREFFYGGLLKTKMIKNKFDSVVFDVDSTLVKIEGLDYIARNKGIDPRIQKITQDAMNGDISMERAMTIKMSAIAPSYNDFMDLGDAYVKNLTKGAFETIKLLNKNAIKVWILSGNFQPAIDVLARHLNINPERVLSNSVTFDDNLNYLEFDMNNPLGKNSGKTKILRDYKKLMGKTAFIGDGITDVEAKNEVDLFIGFGGVVKRPKVEMLADVYIDESDISAILPFVI